MTTTTTITELKPALTLTELGDTRWIAMGLSRAHDQVKATLVPGLFSLGDWRDPNRIYFNAGLSKGELFITRVDDPNYTSRQLLCNG